MKTVLIICYSPLHRDPRVLRQIKAFDGKCRIITAGYTEPENQVESHVTLQREEPNGIFRKILSNFLSFVGMTEFVYWTSTKKDDLNELLAFDADWVLANDIEALPISHTFASLKNAKLIFDAHEYYPDHSQNSGLANKLKGYKMYLKCKKYIKKADFMTVVSSEIGKLYFRKFDVRSEVVTNATDFQPLEPTSVGEVVHLVHHGIAAPARRIELMIEMMGHLDSRFVLHFYILETPGFADYYNFIVEKAKNFKDQIIFHSPIPTNQIAKEINRYDLGVYILPFKTLNQRYALPNKFFEFVQARLGVAIGPSIEMQKYVQKYSLGIVAKDFDPKSLATELNKLTKEQILQFKKNSDESALELSAEKNMAYYTDLVLGEKYAY